MGNAVWTGWCNSNVWGTRPSALTNSAVSAVVIGTRDGQTDRRRNEQPGTQARSASARSATTSARPVGAAFGHAEYRMMY
eukprot:scaffold159_cov60-Phaeocystis_antarctica.AAC.2